MPTEIDDLSRAIKKKVDELVDDIKGLDMDKEAARVLKETEDGLNALGRSVERKRKEMGEKGVERTVRKDAARVLDTVSKAIDDLKRELDPEE